MVAALRPALAKQRIEMVELDWRGPIGGFDGLALVLLGTAWDYQDRAEEFLARLEELEARGVKVCNPPDVVRWNIDKRYLADLAERGAVTVPTLWREDAARADVLAALDAFATDRVVVKRTVGAGGIGQHSFTRGTLPEADWRMGRGAMIQPFLPAILGEGEVTFLFVEGEFSHAVRKRPASGEYRIQSLYGGTESAFAPAPAELAAAQAVIAALPFAPPLYGRVDMVRLPTGELAVMEAELIEPYYYPEQGPRVGDLIAAAVERRLG